MAVTNTAKNNIYEIQVFDTVGNKRSSANISWHGAVYVYILYLYMHIFMLGNLLSLEILWYFYLVYYDNVSMS